MHVLETNTFERIKAMLESSDMENAVLGFQCLKEATLCKENITYILWMIQEANVAKDDWFSHAPEIMDQLGKIVSLSVHLSPSEIMRIMRSYGEDLPKNNYDVFADRYAKYLEKLLALGSSLQFKVELKITRL